MVAMAEERMCSDSIPQSAIEGMVSLNNYGVELLGHGNLHGARQAFYRATDQMKEVLNEQQRELFSMSNANLLNYFLESSDAGCLCIVTPADGSYDSSSSQPIPSIGAGGTEAQHPSSPPSTSMSQEGQQQDADNDDASRFKDGRRRPPTGAASSALNPDQQLNTRHQQQDDSADGVFSFLRPILICSDDFVRARNPPLMQLCVCLLFNLAVTSHTMALMSPPSTQCKAWSEAIYLYRLAYSLQADSQMEVSRLHTLGIVNNLGQLYFHAGNVEKAMECFQLLLDMISVDRARSRGRPSGPSQDAEDALQAPYVQLFLDNIFNLSICHSKLCHSAAA